MVRVLLLIALVWLLYIVIKRAFLDSNNPPSSQNNRAEEKIVQCSACGMHVPESETIQRNSLVVCNNPDCNKNV